MTRNARRRHSPRQLIVRILLALLLAVLALDRPARTAGIIHVTTTAQGLDTSDGACSLSEAIYSANFDDNVVPSSWVPYTPIDSECEPGSGDDVIVLQAGAT